MRIQVSQARQQPPVNKKVLIVTIDAPDYEQGLFMEELASAMARHGTTTVHEPSLTDVSPAGLLPGDFIASLGEEGTRITVLRGRARGQGRS